MFTAEVKQMIEPSSNICDLKLLQEKIHQKGVVLVGLEEGERFINVMSVIIDSYKFFSKKDIRNPLISFTSVGGCIHQRVAL